jgi:hypothetical protein
MNERIKELARQTEFRAVHLLDHYGTVDALTDSEQVELERIDKLAQLIVRECIDILDARRKIHTSPTYRSIDFYDRVDAKVEELMYSVLDIKQHFEVEE